MIPIRRTIFVVAIGLLLTAAAFCQSPCAGVAMPPGTLCISQAAGNAAAENVAVLAATNAKVTTLQESLAKKDETINELKDTARKNETDLTARISATAVELALTKGMLVKTEGEVTRQTATIEFLLNHGRKRCAGIICVQ